MAPFSDIGKKINSIAESAGKKSSEMVESARLHAEIRSFEDQIADLQFELGCAYYAQNKHRPEGPFEDKIQQILRLEQDVLLRNERILSLKGHMFCPGCNAVVGRGDGFCSKCGAQLPVVKDGYEEAQLCENCSAPLSEEQQYCNKCGYLVQESLSI